MNFVIWFWSFVIDSWPYKDIRSIGRLDIPDRNLGEISTTSSIMLLQISINGAIDIK